MTRRLASAGRRFLFLIRGHSQMKNLNLPAVYTSTTEWPKKIPGGLNFLYANPPCAIWSVAGSKKGQDPNRWKQDPRLQRIRDIFSLVERYRPEVWTWESVCQAFFRGYPFVNHLTRQAHQLGYAATIVLLDAQYLNTPQTRRRFFMVFHRIAIDWEAGRPSFDKTISVQQALRGVKPNPQELKRKIPDRIKRLYPHSNPGEDFNKVFNRVVKVKNFKRDKHGRVTGRPSFLVKRMHLKQPGYTVIGAELLHPTQCRALTTNELAALCGFPKSWDWGAGSGLGNYVARGVCPTVGEWLAKQVARAVKRGAKVDRHQQQIVDYRKAPGRILDVTGKPFHPDQVR
jgi:site-specific DNA-cytosine methylase